MSNEIVINDDGPFLEDFEKATDDRRVETPIVRPDEPVEIATFSDEVSETADTFDATTDEAAEDVVTEVPADEFDTSEHPKDEVDLSKMNKAELVAHAESLGLDSVPDSMTKKEIIALIEGE